MFELKNKEDVPYLSSSLLEQTGMVIQGFSTRLGGVSEAHLSSMNLSFSRGDREENVHENFRRIANAIGLDAESFVFSQQTHTTNVRKVTEEDKGKGIVKPLDYQDVDGLITNVPGIALVTFYADCVPLYFADPVRRVIGLSHSGWKGTVGKIGKVTVDRMREEYGSRPEDIIAAVGPSICQECYEVSKDVISEFQKNYDENFWSDMFYQKENGKYQLNLWKANELVFLESGILPEHIEMPGICTCCNSKWLYSHRASKGKRGNLAAFLSIKR